MLKLGDWKKIKDRRDSMSECEHLHDQGNEGCDNSD